MDEPRAAANAGGRGGMPCCTAAPRIRILRMGCMGWWCCCHPGAHFNVVPSQMALHQWCANKTHIGPQLHLAVVMLLLHLAVTHVLAWLRWLLRECAQQFAGDSHLIRIADPARLFTPSIHSLSRRIDGMLDALSSGRLSGSSTPHVFMPIPCGCSTSSWQPQKLPTNSLHVHRGGVPG